MHASQPNPISAGQGSVQISVLSVLAQYILSGFNGVIQSSFCALNAGLSCSRRNAAAEFSYHARKLYS